MKKFLALVLVLASLCTLMTGCGEEVEINLGTGEITSGTGEEESGTSGINRGGIDVDNSANTSGTESETGDVGDGEENNDTPETPVDNRTVGEKYADAAASYANCKGWVCIPNTYVDYPIMQASDNSYYLDKNPAGSYYWYGSVFADYRNNLTSLSSLNQNTILFGHNKADGLIFGNLTKYSDASFAASHPTVTTVINGEEQTWLIVAAMDCETSFNYISTSLSDSTIKSILDRSYIDVGYSVSSSDKFLTLSTCTYKYKYSSGKYREDVRFAVLAVQVPAGTTASVSANTDRVTPTFAD